MIIICYLSRGLANVGRLNILLVAPEHPDLPNVASEVAALSNQHDVVRLLGVVRDADVARAVQEGPYDVLWFASHGDADGVMLSDGRLSIEGVGQFLRATEARLCVLNTCDSENVALSILSSATADMICTIGTVDDQDAARLAILLAGALARSPDPYEAYLLVRPEGGNYRYYRAGSGAPTRRYHDDGVLREIHGRLVRIETQLEELREIKTELKRFDEDLERVKAMPLSTRIVVLAVAVIVGILLGTFLQNFV